MDFVIFLTLRLYSDIRFMLVHESGHGLKLVITDKARSFFNFFYY